MVITTGFFYPRGLIDKFFLQIYNVLNLSRGGIFVLRDTERLSFRRWRREDAPEMFRWAQDPDVGPMAGWPPHQKVEDSLSVLMRFIENDYNENPLILKETGKPIGCIGIKFGARCGSPAKDTIDEAELGCWLAKPYWGQGIMPEAVREALRHCFEDLGCKAVWWGYYAFNNQSKRVQEKCGFTHQYTQKGRVIFDGRAVDEHYSRITKEEWLKLNSKDN